DQKPDVSSYTHFFGSEAEGDGEPDSGTSAACPVMAGVVGAMRTKFTAGAIPPAQLRAVIAKTSANLGLPGYDYDYGWGAVDPVALADGLAATPGGPVKKAGGTTKAAKKAGTKSTTKAAKSTKAKAAKITKT